MKKYVFVLLAVLMMSTSLKAAPGDTTWVQANIAQLSYYNNYDTLVHFPAPGTSYRKIYMIFTLGKYMCPAGSTYCGDWDYTVLNYLMTPGGDTLELARLITPYANAAAPRTPWTWLQHYVYDVTDYAYLLHDTATMRILFSGYSGGFTANVRFAFIEGTPDRDVIAIHKLWTGSYTYGDTTHLDSFDINTHFPTLAQTVPTGTQASEVKFLVTGHGSDNNYCCEFMSHNYHVLLNGSTVADQTVWRSDCGSNELYPQSGTWLYERANWCPGALVHPNFHALPGLLPGAHYNVDIQFDPYIGQPNPSGGGRGSYTTEASIIYYGAMNKILDASLDQIIAPTTDENHFRENPRLGVPTVHVKNTGAQAIDSITFQYGIQDSAMQTYTWVGTLAPLQETDLDLAQLGQLSNVAGVSGTFTFVAKITAVNGVADDDNTNNTMTSQFVAAPVFPSPFKIAFLTNNEAIATGSSICETSWIIYDMNNNIVQQRTGATISKLYKDTVYLPKGYYKLQVYDSSCDGLNWWANSGTGISSGYLYAQKMAGTNIPLNGNNMGGTYVNDFGCGFVQYFYLDSTSVDAVQHITAGGVGIEAYPNPAQNVVNVDISGMQSVRGTIEIIDMLGRVASVTQCNSGHQQINTEKLANGIYTILFINETGGNKLQARLLITK